jgi:pyridoxal phosphate enzyme (YggS family)
MVDSDVVRANLAEVRAAVDEAAATAGRPAGSVAILAAVKYVTRDDLAALAEAGVDLVGENRTDALISKQEGFADAFRWDFIGHLQSRKARDVVGRVELVHALSAESTARQIDARSERPQDVLVEVNVAADPGKEGVSPAELDPFLELLAALANVRVRGLMTMPPFAEDPEASRPVFAALRDLAAACAQRWSGTHAFDVLSMGTSQDYAVAAGEGATIVRLGSVLYGGRPTQ